MSDPIHPPSPLAGAAAADDDDLDALFAAYLGHLSPDRVRALAAMDIGPVDHCSHAGMNKRRVSHKPTSTRTASTSRIHSHRKGGNAGGGTANESRTTSAINDERSNNTVNGEVDGEEEDEVDGDRWIGDSVVPFTYESTIAGRFNLLTNPKFSNHNHNSKDVTAQGSVAPMRRCFDFGDLMAQVLPASDQVGSQEQIAEALSSVTVAHLSGCGIEDADLLMCLHSLTRLYVPHNAITDISAIAALPRLTVLVIAHNAVASLAPLAVLQAVVLLDARHNCIAALDPARDLPAPGCLADLRLDGNPCAPMYKKKKINNMNKKKDIMNSNSDIDSDADSDSGDGCVGSSGGACGTATHKKEEEEDEGDPYVGEYRAAVLEYCPRLRFLDGFEVAVFAPEHAQRQGIDSSGGTLLTFSVINYNNNNNNNNNNYTSAGPAEGGCNDMGIDSDIDQAIRRDEEMRGREPLSSDRDRDRSDGGEENGTVGFAPSSSLLRAFLCGSNGSGPHKRGRQQDPQAGPTPHEPKPPSSSASSSSDPDRMDSKKGTDSAGALSLLPGTGNWLLPLDDSDKDDTDVIEEAGEWDSSGLSTGNPSRHRNHRLPLEDRKELGRALGRVQRHCGRVAAVRLAEIWDEAVGPLRRRREDRRPNAIDTSSTTITTTTTALGGLNGGDTSGHSAAYLAAIEALKKEAKTADLDRYRRKN